MPSTTAAVAGFSSPKLISHKSLAMETIERKLPVVLFWSECVSLTCGKGCANVITNVNAFINACLENLRSFEEEWIDKDVAEVLFPLRS